VGLRTHASATLPGRAAEVERGIEGDQPAAIEDCDPVAHFLDLVHVVRR
jgi:hypothetical protein